MSVRNSVGKNRTSSRKLKYDAMRKELPVIVPYLWVPLVSRCSHIKKQHCTEHTIPWTGPHIDEILYISGLIHLPSLLCDTGNILSRYITNSSVVVYLVDQAMNEIYVNPFAGEHLCDRVSQKIRPDSTIAAYVADKKKAVMLNNLKIVEPYSGFDWKGLTVTATLAVPIITADNECAAVIEMYRRNGENYNTNNLNVVKTVGRWIATAIDHNKNRLQLQIKQQMEKYLLEITQYYFTMPDEIHLLILDIVNYAKSCLNSTRGCFFPLNGDKLTHDSSMTITDLSIAELTMNLNKLLNVENAHNDGRFLRENDGKTHHITRSALSMPIIGRNDRIFGVLLIVNKHQGCYTVFDENLFQIIAKYCVMALEYTQLHRALIVSEKRGLMYDELYFYKILTKRPLPKIGKPMTLANLPNDFYEFSFHPSANDNLIQLSCWLLKNFKMTRLEIENLVICIHNGYRNVPYHNFEHAFVVTHAVALMVERNPDKFSDIEKMAFLMATLCHDIDHRGNTNHFIEISDHPLITLYDESPMENHHFFITLIILQNSPLRKLLSQKDYMYMIDLIRHLILSSDITRHLNDRCEMVELCAAINEKGTDVWCSNEEYRSIVQSLMITSADLSGEAKAFQFAHISTKNVILEFLEEGERLRLLGQEVPPPMDINCLDQVPQMQVQFLEVVCVPCFDFLRIVLPNTSEMYYLAKNLLHTWQEIIRIRAENSSKPAIG